MIVSLKTRLVLQTHSGGRGVRVFLIHHNEVMKYYVAGLIVVGWLPSAVLLVVVGWLLV